LNKRPRADTPPSSPLRPDFAAETTSSPRKRTRKTSQLLHFCVHEDQTSTANRAKIAGQDDPTPSLIGRQIDKIHMATYIH
jgi:hypothetical protein